MTVYIVAARIDERGKISGGAAGDSTGREVCRQTLASSGAWSRVLRPPSNGSAIAAAALAAAANDNIGYDQRQRMTLYYAARDVGFDLSRVGPCECDCSSLVAVCCIAAGFSVNPSMYTGNERAALTGAGFADIAYSSASLRIGDVLWRNGHTAIVVDGGASAQHPGNSGTSRPLLEVDGVIGPATIRALQAALSTPVDGVVSNQRAKYKKNWPACMSSVWHLSTHGSSPMIAALQRVCGCGADGIAGPATCRALQARLGVSVDGICGPNTAKALQRRLNNGGGI